MNPEPLTVEDIQRELDALSVLAQSSKLDDDDKATLATHFQLLDQQFEEFTSSWPE